MEGGLSDSLCLLKSLAERPASDSGLLQLCRCSGLAGWESPSGDSVSPGDQHLEAAARTGIELTLQQR